MFYDSYMIWTLQCSNIKTVITILSFNSRKRMKIIKENQQNLFISSSYFSFLSQRKANFPSNLEGNKLGTTKNQTTEIMVTNIHQHCTYTKPKKIE